MCGPERTRPSGLEAAASPLGIWTAQHQCPTFAGEIASFWEQQTPWNFFISCFVWVSSGVFRVIWVCFWLSDSEDRIVRDEKREWLKGDCRGR